MKFPNAEALYEHTRTSHANLGCNICGSSVSRKSYKRHLMSHDDNETKPRLFCPYDGCTRSYANVRFLLCVTYFCYYNHNYKLLISLKQCVLNLFPIRAQIWQCTSEFVIWVKKITDVLLKIVVKHLAIGIPEITMKSLVNTVTVR